VFRGGKKGRSKFVWEAGQGMGGVEKTLGGRKKKGAVTPSVELHFGGGVGWVVVGGGGGGVGIVGGERLP